MSTETHTPGPWHLVATDGTDFTAIATKAEICGDLDLDAEVLGTSEWLRASPEDLRLMATAPELFAALRDLVDVMTGHMEGETVASHNALAVLRKATGAA